MLEKNINDDTIHARLRDVEWTFGNISRGKDIVKSPEALFATVYGAYICKKNGIEQTTELEKYLSDRYLNNNDMDRRYFFIKQKLNGDFSIPVEFNLSGKFTEDEYLFFFKYYSEWADELYGYTDMMKGSFYSTPESVTKLACRVLDLKKTDTVADFGCGIGNFLLKTSEFCKEAKTSGFDINTDAVEIAAIRAEIFMMNIDIEQKGIFSIETDRKFSKIFSNFPFGLSMRNVSVNNPYMDQLYDEIPDLRKVMQAEWVFVAKIQKHIDEGGKAVVIMNNGSSWNLMNTNIRRFFVEEGLIEAVIALPTRLFPYTQIGTDMLVLSRGNDSIRMIDARELCDKGRRMTTFSNKNIDEIISLLKKDSDKAKTVDKIILSENDFVLNPSRYIDAPIKIKDGVKFGDVIKRITRGAQLTAIQLDTLVTEKSTGYKYLMLSDIQNGIISDDLKNLKSIESRLERYIIPDRALLLSKNGAPFKVAVAEVKKGEQILGNGNLFIIELDEEKVNPFYLKAFFHSELGSLSLQKIAVGASIPNISAESLRNLVIPLPSLEVQDKIAELYQTKVDEVKVLQLRLKKAQEELKGIFGEVD